VAPPNTAGVDVAAADAAADAAAAAAVAVAAAAAAAAAARLCPRVDPQHARVIPPPRTGTSAYGLQKPLPLQDEEDQVHRPHTGLAMHDAIPPPETIYS